MDEKIRFCNKKPFGTYGDIKEMTLERIPVKLEFPTKIRYNVHEHNEPGSCEADIWRMCVRHDEAERNHGIEEHNEPGSCEADIWRMCVRHDEAKRNHGIEEHNEPGSCGCYRLERGK